MPRRVAGSSRRCGVAVPDDVLVGCETPRLGTKPLRKLTRHTSLGFECIAFAEDVLGFPLLPWQKWWLIHALELDENGDFRFRVILTLVARQSGKTTLLVILALWMMYLGRARLVLGSAQSLDIAREAWQSAVDAVQADPELAAEVGSVRFTNGEQQIKLLNGARYRIAASTRSAGRGLSVDLLILDELREHRDWLAWSALSKTTTARPCALTVGISNAGDDESVVLNSLRERALADADPTLAIFEWSAEDGCELDDRQAWAQANPGLGHTVSEQAIATSLATDPPAVFRTEVLCQRVDSLNSAIDLFAWKACADPAGTMDAVRQRIAICLDAAPDGEHVSLLVGALLDDGRVRVEAAAAWPNTTACRKELRGLIERIRPYATAWFPAGPIAALAPELKSGAFGDLGVQVPITGGAVAEACQGLADLVAARRVIHPGDPLIDAHVAGAQKLTQGDGWRFVRRGVGHVDACYAVAGVCHTVLTVPVPAPMPRSMIV